MDSLLQFPMHHFYQIAFTSGSVPNLIFRHGIAPICHSKRAAMLSNTLNAIWPIRERRAAQCVREEWREEQVKIQCIVYHISVLIRTLTHALVE